MKKKIIVLLLAAVMVLGLCGCGDSASDSGNASGGVSGEQEAGRADEDGKAETSGATGEVTLEALMSHEVTPVEDFEYEVRPETIKITSYLGTDNMVVIPEEIDGMPVTEVSYTTFSEGNGANVEGVRYGNNINLIGMYAFSGPMGTNDSIKYIVLGENVKTISDYAFSSCFQLEYIELNDNLEDIGLAIFSGSAITDVTLPDGLTDYSVGAFYGMNVHVSEGSEAEAYLNSVQEAGDDGNGNSLESCNITVIVE